MLIDDLENRPGLAVDRVLLEETKWALRGQHHTSCEEIHGLKSS